jgi:hypothetical protein
LRLLYTFKLSVFWFPKTRYRQLILYQSFKLFEMPFAHCPWPRHLLRQRRFINIHSFHKRQKQANQY